MTLGRQLYKGSGRALRTECSVEWGLNRSDLQGKTPGRGNSPGERPAVRWGQGKAGGNTAGADEWRRASEMKP